MIAKPFATLSRLSHAPHPATLHSKPAFAIIVPNRIGVGLILNEAKNLALPRSFASLRMTKVGFLAGDFFAIARLFRNRKTISQSQDYFAIAMPRAESRWIRNTPGTPRYSP
jgi:hypothetical protein